MASPAALTSWLDWVSTSCGQAAEWLANDVFVSVSSADVTELLELIEEFLNLPLWRQRHLLYEIWVLCATLGACEQASWVVQLRGLTVTNGVWTLSVGPTDVPVAALHHETDSTTVLDVWHEPERATSTGVLTPDVTVSTPRPYPRDLLVVEAKDRHKMPLGVTQIPEKSRVTPAADRQTALGVAQRYATGLRPPVTWVCNHCDYRPPPNAATNHGDAWTRIHVAAQFRPGNVPLAFTKSVQAALIPPLDTRPEDDSDTRRHSGFVLVVDVTASMSDVLESAFTTLTEEPAWAIFDEYRAVLYSDHGNGEPFLVRKIGPFRDLGSLINAVICIPKGGGGDWEEALEDAMQRCRELTDDIGPQSLLVLTDAPPHTAETCPYTVDFEKEVRALIDAGCHIQVANDWLCPENQAWAPFQATPGFYLAPLREIIAR